ncbi:MAG: hypothetical protein H7Z72_19785 [Bacteroidetes bacterium]|nr:hypothetical protein [Fibrella sp.]
MLTARLVVDFGLVVLIWLVQLIIYPGFAYYSPADLAIWHPKYTSLITFVVGPLMLAQVAATGLSLTSQFSWLTLIVAVLVVVVWWSTAFQAIPLHNRIDAGIDLPRTIADLVRVNWPRTIIWTLIFGIDLFQYYTR